GIIFFIFAALWYFSKGKAFGFGDAKLGVSLGALVGLAGVFSLIVFSFWIGALLSIFIICLQSLLINTGLGFGFGRHVNIKSEIPFAPFLIVSFVLVYFFSADVNSVIGIVLALL